MGAGRVVQLLEVFGTAWLVMLARVLGARVTSWGRSVEANQRVGGSPTSKHLRMGAVDVAADAPDRAVRLLKQASANGDSSWHEKGTAKHWHFEGRPMIGAVVLLVVLWFVRQVFR